MAEYQHDVGEGLEALRTSGLLFALNEHVLHGAGYEARVTDDRLVLVGWGEKPREWDATPEQLDEVWRRFRQTKLDAQTFNNPSYHEGHSPGFNARGNR